LKIEIEVISIYIQLVAGTEFYADYRVQKKDFKLFCEELNFTRESLIYISVIYNKLNM